MVKIKISLYSLCQLIVVVILALPLYGSNVIGKVFTGPAYYFLFMMGLVSLLIYAGNERKKYNVLTILTLLYVLSVMLAFFKESNIFDKTNLIVLRWYLFPPMAGIIIFVVFNRKNKKDLDYFVEKIILFPSIIAATITLIMIITKSLPFWQISTYLGNRLGGSYESIYLVSVPCAVYLLYKKRKKTNNVIIIVFVIEALITSIYAQSRLLAALMIVEIVAVAFIGDKRRTKRKIIVSGTVFVGLVIGLLIFYKGNSDLLLRFTHQNEQIVNSSGRIRLYTDLYNLKQGINEPFGHGFTEPMHQLNGIGVVRQLKQDGSRSGNYIDNTYITQLFHGGFVLIIAFLLFLIAMYKNLIEKYKSNKNSFWLIMIISVSSFILNCTVFSSQTIHEIGVSSMMWILIYMSFIEWEEKQIIEIQK